MSQPVLQNAPELPTQLSVATILEKRPAVSRWAQNYWSASAVIVGESAHQQVTLVHEQQGVQQYLYPALPLRLYIDECAGYYHNLSSPNPSCYIIASIDANGTPQPQRITLSFDEANAYLQGSEEVYAVPLPAELYRWSEAFVLQHYVPEKKRKRRLVDWKAKDSRGH